MIVLACSVISNVMLCTVWTIVHICMIKINNFTFKTIYSIFTIHIVAKICTYIYIYTNDITENTFNIVYKNRASLHNRRIRNELQYLGM